MTQIANGDREKYFNLYVQQFPSSFDINLAEQPQGLYYSCENIH